MTARRERFEVAPEDAGMRLDQVLAKRIEGLSRRKARVLVDIGGVFVDRTRVKVASRPVRSGQVIEAVLGNVLDRATGEVGAAARAVDAAALPDYRIVHEDDDLVVVDKPAGLVTAPTPESDRGDLLDQLTGTYGEVYLVHRIDLPTSGLLVFARTRDANKQLGDRFKEHDVEREYRAVAVGQVDAQTIDREIEKRRAVTHVEPVETFSQATLVRVRLETGRTHQIRVHLTHRKLPLVGDPLYGPGLRLPKGAAPELVEALRAFKRQALHAELLEFEHPADRSTVRVEAPPPADFRALLDALRADRDAANASR